VPRALYLLMQLTASMLVVALGLLAVSLVLPASVSVTATGPASAPCTPQLCAQRWLTDSDCPRSGPATPSAALASATPSLPAPPAPDGLDARPDAVEDEGPEDCVDNVRPNWTERDGS
jgi:hypothetical protein